MEYGIFIIGFVLFVCDVVGCILGVGKFVGEKCDVGCDCMVGMVVEVIFVGG